MVRQSHPIEEWSSSTLCLKRFPELLRSIPSGDTDALLAIHQALTARGSMKTSIPNPSGVIPVKPPDPMVIGVDQPTSAMNPP